MKSDVTSAVLEEARRFLGSKEELLQCLKNHGLTKIRSIAAYAEIAGISLGRSKIEVHFSETWAHERGAHERFHENLFAVLDETPIPPRYIRSRRGPNPPLHACESPEKAASHTDVQQKKTADAVFFVTSVVLASFERAVRSATKRNSVGRLDRRCLG